MAAKSTGESKRPKDRSEGILDAGSLFRADILRLSKAPFWERLHREEPIYSKLRQIVAALDAMLGMIADDRLLAVLKGEDTTSLDEERKSLEAAWSELTLWIGYRAQTLLEDEVHTQLTQYAEQIED